ncbi:MAG TPA: TetR/AcrR family transcriptional regulator [Solirubrobacteraceae bacterium]
MPTRSTSEKATAEPRRSPRERLLEAANELFYAEGIQSVGIDRVIERAGVAKASLYSTFGSKEELVRAYLDDRHARLLGWRRAAAAAVDDPVEKILAVFDSQARDFSRPDFNGCAFAGAMAESPPGGRVDQASRSFRQDIRSLFEELAAGAGAKRPALLARQLHMLYEGAGSAAKLDHDGATVAAQARAAAAALISAAL